MSDVVAQIWELMEAAGIDHTTELADWVADAVEAGAPFLVVDIIGEELQWVATPDSIPDAVESVGGLAVVIVTGC